MKFFKANVTREESCDVYFSAPDDAKLGDLRELAERAADELLDSDWERGPADADCPIEVSKQEASEWIETQAS